MTLSPGARLGPYEITASLGHGGMGEVYKAHDTRLDRTVAIKVVAGTLPAFGGGDGLEREARAVAALNHPHICALHDLGRDGDTPFLVMEYVKGETLAARLSRGRLPPRDVIRFGIQIAEALDHAHRNGVVHRDLKPGNIMITSSGVKVLDFGLATLRAATPLPMPVEGMPTVKHQLASEQTLLGTVHYMAPERLEGSEADEASDLFALGGIIYEMATGRRPFESGSPAGVIAAILHADPPAPSTIEPGLPSSIDWVVQKALAKNPAARWRAAGDIVEVLRWIARGPERQVPPPARSRTVVPLAAALLVVGGALVLAFAGAFRAAVPAPPLLTFSILPPAGGGFTPTPSSVPTPQFALSPNGRRLAFVASVAHEAPQLWMRALDSLTPEPLPNTQGAEYPFWSPDSESIGFFANGVLKRVDLNGGPPRVLAAAPHGRGGAWSRSGIILFAPHTQRPLYRVAAVGGDAKPLTQVDEGRHEVSHRWPQFLPDDTHFLYFAQAVPPETHAIYVGSLDGSPPHKLLAAPLSAAYVAPGYLLFVADDALMATRFNAATQQLLGEPSPIVPAIAGSSNFHAAFSASVSGLLAYASRGASAELVWLDRDGRRHGPAGPPLECVDFRLSPDDRQLALAEVDARTHRPDIRVLDLRRGASLRLTADAATDASPVWSPDGQRIVFRSNRTGQHDLYQKAAHGAADAMVFLRSQSGKYPTDWTPDGQRIVYHTDSPGTGSDIWLVSLDGSSPTPLVQTIFDEMQGQVSPDGRWLAYTSLETGQSEVYVRSLSDPTRRWPISAGGGSDPRWRGDGRELFYVSADSSLTSVDFLDGYPAAPRPLFKVHVVPPGKPYLSNYDVTADARRFLVKVPAHDVTSTPIHVVTNWLDLKPASR